MPHDMLRDIEQARIVITNYHAFRLRERLDVAKGTRTALEGWRKEKLQTVETEGQMLQRVMPELMNLPSIVVLNDEAHHCYREKPGNHDIDDLKGDDKDEAKRNNEAARLWISGLEAVKRGIGRGKGKGNGISAVFDLSATPFFLQGSGYAEGTLFPWTVSDFSLMDAIECGIVKLPRVPVADNVPGADMPKFRNLWEHIGKKMPKAGRGQSKTLDPLSLPAELQTALYVLYGHYKKTFTLWEEAGIGVPPVFIVVCNNTATSKLVYDFISGFERANDDGTTALENGRLALFRNYDDFGNRLPRPRTLLIDSEQLESGEALDKNFRDMAADEIDRFRREIVERTGDIRRGEALTDQDLLREVMNTVGKPSRLGEQIRCVVSVSMLTEGWDANTVTHILGVRAFGTQLLCEQVVGRALRRQSYELNEEGLFNVEYADVLGVPFDFNAKPVVAPPAKPRETVRVQAVRPDRDALEITFPRVEGYRVELPEERLSATFGPDSVLELNPDLVGPSVTKNQGIIGEGVDLTIDHLEDMRQSTILFHLARHLLYQKYRDPGEEPKLHLFGQLKRITRQWLEGGYLRCIARYLPGAADLQGNRRHGGRTHQGRHHRGPGRRTPHQGNSGRLQPYRVYSLRQLHHVQGNAVADRPRPLPRQLGALRQRLGSRVLPCGRGAPARARLRQEPQPRPGGALPPGRHTAQVPAGLHRADRRRPGRAAQPDRRDQGLPGRGRQGEGQHHARLLGAGREQPGQVRPLGLRRVHGRV
ncbi:hypothetical protein GCM10009099_30960 [Caenispirillum bisanense]